ncbi:hypothetical protein MMC17_001803 [Xylographa soralifera]|nr:hypothetical protein [Xylographa soralifera]
MPSVEYFLNRQPNGFYSGSVLEGVDEKGDSTVAKRYCIDGHEKNGGGAVVPTDRQSDYSISIPSDTSRSIGHDTTLQEDRTLISLIQEKESAPPASGFASGTLGDKVSESLTHHLLAWNLGQELLALHLSLSKDPCLAPYPSTPARITGKIPSDKGSSGPSLNSYILVLHYGLERTNIATRDWPSLVVPQIFTAFGVSTASSINHLVQSLDFMSVAACKHDRPHQLVLWCKDKNNGWIPGDVWALDPRNETLTLKDKGWKGGVDNPIRISLLRRPYYLKFQKDIGMWKVG